MGLGPAGTATRIWPPAATPTLAEPIEYWPPLLDGGDNAIIRSGASNLVQYVVDPEHRFQFDHLRGSRLRQGCRLSHGLGPKPGWRFRATQRQQRAAGAVVRQLQAVRTFNLDFTGPNPAAYFPSTYSYVLAPASTRAPASAGVDQSMSEFLCYSVGQGQNDAAPLLYAPAIPGGDRHLGARRPGHARSSPASQCGIGGTAPAVTPGKIVGNNGNPGPSAAGPVAGGGSGGRRVGRVRIRRGPAGRPRAERPGRLRAGRGLGRHRGRSRLCRREGRARPLRPRPPPGELRPPAPAPAASRRPDRTDGRAKRGAGLRPLEAVASGQTNSETYWYLLIGAGVCALGVGLGLQEKPGVT